jgi:hypothetical protein
MWQGRWRSICLLSGWQNKDEQVLGSFRSHKIEVAHKRIPIAGCQGDRGLDREETSLVRFGRPAPVDVRAGLERDSRLQ